jgi:hypothetical protein
MRTRLNLRENDWAWLTGGQDQKSECIIGRRKIGDSNKCLAGDGADEGRRHWEKMDISRWREREELRENER